MAKLIGSLPGYLGHRKTQCLLSHEALDQHHADPLKLSFILFDEIEKASEALWNLLLGILDKATLTLGDNQKVDFSQFVIFMTSNLARAR
ncbi:MAG TPA: AAA family ATPase [Bryobacteraceae bacterium]|nr:AAA family ATPase [Bryobacteraceae bacterium]